ncbi:hypothetical protein LTR53_015561 [Teratosphaeriaceae sp. CCFEE 6253]|nr:hypothetical protein LTR53_015561 [Teratosphaeriaceae sp. CCFEE 6253]
MDVARATDAAWCVSASLAISGGVDSMAMASLCSEAVRHGLLHPLLVGFIVDHELREGSTQEAHGVAEELRRLHIEPRVLTLDWRQHENPRGLDHLEHAARKLRYQAIGKACCEHGTDSLLVAHHADDQAETVLMRLVAKYFGSGLQGVTSGKSIPECKGIHGVHGSGSPRSTGARASYSDGIAIEDGGVNVFRPLLTFTKAELVAYCKMAQVPWVEDRTNANPTFAVRNTIRYLHDRALLPVALRMARLNRLAAKAARREARYEAVARDLFDRMAISLHLATGVVTFDDITLWPTMSTELHGQRKVAAVLLRKLLSLVAPVNDIKMQDLFHLAGVLWPGLRDVELDLSRLRQHDPRQLAGASISRPLTGVHNSPWTVVRQLPARKDLVLGRTRLTTSRDGAHAIWRSSTWQLWDHRYWIRVYQRATAPHAAQRHDIEARFLTKEDLADSYRAFAAQHQSEVRRLLSLVPHNLWFTLPVLAITPTDRTSEQQVVALPSLGWSANGWAKWNGEDSVNGNAAEWFWSIRYRKVDIGQGEHHTVTGCFLTAAAAAAAPMGIQQTP